MVLKIIAGIISVALLFAYIGPVVLRLNEIALWVIVLLGLGMMLVDLWESLKEKD